MPALWSGKRPAGPGLGLLPPGGPAKAEKERCEAERDPSGAHIAQAMGRHVSAMGRALQRFWAEKDVGVKLLTSASVLSYSSLLGAIQMGSPDPPAQLTAKAEDTLGRKYL